MSIMYVMREFRVELGESYDDEKYRREWKDVFTASLGRLWLRFVERGG